jgi:hypothetical protein
VAQMSRRTRDTMWRRREEVLGSTSCVLSEILSREYGGQVLFVVL